MKRFALMALFLFGFTSAALAADYKEGTHYLRVSEQGTDSGDKIEVLEFFWYGCPHCYVFDPIIEKWLANKPANAEFSRVPTVFRPEWKVHARAYYALEVMGVTDKYHSKIFDAMHKNKKRLDRIETVSDFLASQGLDKKEFLEVYNSFNIDNMVRKAIKKLDGYKITGVPAMAVNGKYVVTGKNAGSYENMLKIVDYLVQKETAAKK